VRKQVTPPNLNVDGNQIEFVKEFKYLGIILDSNMSWKAHINNISCKIAKTNGIMCRLKNTLPGNILKMMYNSLILPYLQYGILVWGTNSGRLLKLQKKSVRTITNAKYNAHTDPIFKSLRLLKVIDILKVQECKFLFKLEKNTLPNYFHSCMFIRHSQVHSYHTRHASNFVTPPGSHAFVVNGIRYRLPSVYNDLPPEIKQKIYTHSYQGFSNYVKNFYINKYDSNCNEANCYVCQHN
jgi:hypothetical protein